MNLTTLEEIVKKITKRLSSNSTRIFIDIARYNNNKVSTHTRIFQWYVTKTPQIILYFWSLILISYITLKLNNKHNNSKIHKIILQVRGKFHVSSKSVMLDFTYRILRKNSLFYCWFYLICTRLKHRSKCKTKYKRILGWKVVLGGTVKPKLTYPLQT